jgi:uncharacterized protein YeaO (DUF488 family)
VTVSIVQLGSPRAPDEGLRIGTVRRPPRGVPKADFARRDFYDIWLPALSPSAALVAEAKSASDRASWQRFRRRFRTEMAQPDTARLLDLLAALSHRTNFSVGCYCEDESRCHRGVLRDLLVERAAKVSGRP